MEFYFYISAKLKDRKAKLVLHLDETPFLAEPFPFELKIAVDMLLTFHFNAPSPNFLVLGARCGLLCLVVVICQFDQTEKHLDERRPLGVSVVRVFQERINQADGRDLPRIWAEPFHRLGPQME